MRIILATAFALVCFAANSVLCRAALGAGLADAAGFTIVRLVSGALVLALLLRIMGLPVLDGVERPNRTLTATWLPAVLLFTYAAGFSFAYLMLDTATGALVLFGSVQLTIVLAGLLRGQWPGGMEWIGLLLACAGLGYLLLPGASAPSLQGFLFMAMAGVAWGCYTLAGAGSLQPLRDTTANFIRTLPLLVGLLFVALPEIDLSPAGVGLAFASGGLASGIGYAAWYLALPRLSTTQSAVLQLAVPVLAAAGGILLLGESASEQLLQSGGLILGGILLVTLGRKGRRRRGSVI